MGNTEEVKLGWVIKRPVYDTCGIEAAEQYKRWMKQERCFSVSYLLLSEMYDHHQIMRSKF